MRCYPLMLAYGFDWSLLGIKLISMLLVQCLMYSMQNAYISLLFKNSRIVLSGLSCCKILMTCEREALCHVQQLLYKNHSFQCASLPQPYVNIIFKVLRKLYFCLYVQRWSTVSWYNGSEKEQVTVGPHFFQLHHFYPMLSSCFYFSDSDLGLFHQS